MPTSNRHYHLQHRSSSTNASRRPREREAQVRVPRSTSVPQREVMIILTNNSEILRAARQLRQQNDSNTHTAMILRTDSNVPSTINENDREREQLLTNLLEVELRESVQGYLSRTRRSFPIYCVMRLSDTEF